MIHAAGAVRRFVLLAWGLLPAAGCASIPFYDIRLTEVQRPASAREQYGEQVVTRLTEDARKVDTVRNYQFEDGLVRVEWAVTGQLAFFTLVNKTKFGIQIPWERAAMVLPNGQSSAVMHEGVRYEACQESKPPTVVVSGSSIVESMIPCRSLFQDYRGAWELSYMFPIHTERGSIKLAELNARDRGKTIKILLPIVIEGVTNEYAFTFGVDSVYATKKKTKPGASAFGIRRD
jgi:hypothetical protein